MYPRQQHMSSRFRCAQEHNLLTRYFMLSRYAVRNIRVSTVLSLAKMVESRDQNTGGHLERIREYSKAMTHALADQPLYRDLLTAEYIQDLELSSMLHDIGKVGIPDEILFKPARLTRAEYATIKQHTVLGEKVLSQVEVMLEGRSFLRMSREIALSHHERWDGKGYPHGLHSHAIPLGARLVALADVYDALTSKRCYKDGFSHAKAMRLIVNERGGHFDPDVVDAFLSQEKAFDRLRQSMDPDYPRPRAEWMLS